MYKKKQKKNKMKDKSGLLGGVTKTWKQSKVSTENYSYMTRILDGQKGLQLIQIRNK